MKQPARHSRPPGPRSEAPEKKFGGALLRRRPLLGRRRRGAPSHLIPQGRSDSHQEERFFSRAGISYSCSNRAPQPTTRSTFRSPRKEVRWGAAAPAPTSGCEGGAEHLLVSLLQNGWG